MAFEMRVTSSGFRRVALAVLAVAAAALAALDLSDPQESIGLYYGRAAWAGWHQPAPRCAACANDEALRRHILAAVPGLEHKLAADPLAAVLALRDWTAATVDGGTFVTAQAVEQARFSESRGAAHLFRTLDDDAGGTQCGGAASFFRAVLALFGIEAVDYNVGHGAGVDTHVLNLVALPAGAGVRIYPVDAWFAASLRDARGAPLDLDGVAAAARGAGRLERELGRFRPRPFILAREDMGNLGALRPKGCRPYALGGNAAYVCRETWTDDFDEYFSPARLALRQARATEVYADYLLNRAMSLSAGMTGSNKAALCATLDRLGICGGPGQPCRIVCAAPRGAKASGAPDSPPRAAAARQRPRSGGPT